MNHDAATATFCPKCGSPFDMPGQSFCPMCNWTEDAYQRGEGPEVINDELYKFFQEQRERYEQPEEPYFPPQTVAYFTVTPWPAPGSSLFSIATLFGCTVRELAELNPELGYYSSRPEMVYPGTQVRVPQRPRG